MRQPGPLIRPQAGSAHQARLGPLCGLDLAIAAASLGTPFRAIASNTPKIQATMELLGGPAVVQTMDAAGSAAIRGFLEEALAGRAEPVAAASVHKVVALAANNFVRL